MDAKTAVECLVDKGMWISSRFIQIYDKKAKEIADFIIEQEKYAELGKLALEFLADNDYCSDACAISAFKDGVNDNCKECYVFIICQKRAELLDKMEG